MRGRVSLCVAQAAQSQAGTRHVADRVVRPDCLPVLLTHEATGRPHTRAAAWAWRSVGPAKSAAATGAAGISPCVASREFGGRSGLLGRKGELHLLALRSVKRAQECVSRRHDRARLSVYSGY